MKENLVSLAKLLATDDAFNLAFSSRGTDEEKYELAKTKFTDLTREDFSEFMEKLREAEKANLAELSPDELEMVAGGTGGWATKLAAAAMFVTALGATGVMSQQADAAPTQQQLRAILPAPEVTSDTLAQLDELIDYLQQMSVARLNGMLNYPERGNVERLLGALSRSGIEMALPFFPGAGAAILQQARNAKNQFDAINTEKVFFDNLKTRSLSARETFFRDNFKSLTEDFHLPDNFFTAYDDDEEVVSLTLDDENSMSCTKKAMEHILFGEFTSYGKFKSGGHTKYWLQLFNLYRHSFQGALVNAGIGDSFGAIADTAVLSSEPDDPFPKYTMRGGNGNTKGVFPHTWTWFDISDAITNAFNTGVDVSSADDIAANKRVMEYRDEKSGINFTLVYRIVAGRNILVTFFPI